MRLWAFSAALAFALALGCIPPGSCLAELAGQTGCCQPRALTIEAQSCCTWCAPPAASAAKFALPNPAPDCPQAPLLQALNAERQGQTALPDASENVLAALASPAFWTIHHACAAHTICPVYAPSPPLPRPHLLLCTFLI